MCCPSALLAHPRVAASGVWAFRSKPLTANLYATSLVLSLGVMLSSFSAASGNWAAAGAATSLNLASAGATTAARSPDTAERVSVVGGAEVSLEGAPQDANSTMVNRDKVWVFMVLFGFYCSKLNRSWAFSTAAPSNAWIRCTTPSPALLI